jgi:hypothetical protein
MTALSALWLPILLSAVIVFVVSSIIHMGPFWHKNDYPRSPNEDRVLDALRPIGLAPGDYMMPRPADTAEMKSAAFKEKMKRGPALLMTVFPPWDGSMAANLTQWFVYILVVSYFAAYVTSRALAPGAPYLEVFRFAGTTAFLAYSMGLWQMSIWYRRAWRITLTSTFDGLIYGLLTAGVFGWLWPR